jgi:hypothetical protein
MRMRRISAVCCVVGVALLLSASPAFPIILDFETLAEGEIVSASNLPPGFTISVVNDNPAHPDVAIIYDTSCPGGCSGEDPDLMTPGFGVGNDTAQGKMMIIAEDVVDTSPADGLVDDPDDEAAGGEITITFPVPLALVSFRMIDIEPSADPKFVELALTGGGTLVLFAAELGNNSAQTILGPAPVLADSMRIVFAESGAIDDFEFLPACGDGVTEGVETCDGASDAACPGACLPDCTCPATTTTTTTTTSTTSTTTTSTTTTNTVTTTSTTTTSTTTTSTTTTTTLPVVCGDGVVGPGEQCEPPGTETCNNSFDDDADGLVDCADVDDCPEGLPTCRADCQLAPACERLVRDPGLIVFDAREELDLIKVHGRFPLDLVPDFESEPFVVLLSNAAGQIYRGTLVPTQMQAVNPKRPGRYRFKDKEAKNFRGDADGLYRVAVKIQQRKGETWCRFKFHAYADLSAATVPLMTTQITAGTAKGTLTAEWKRTNNGWFLRDKIFASE